LHVILRIFIFEGMKKLFVFYLLSVFFVACTNSDSVPIGSRTTVSYEPSYDVGMVAKGEQVKVKIKLTNSGSEPLIVSDVQAGCSCTATSRPKKPIPPSGSDYIEANVNTSNFAMGKFSRNVRIIANTRPSPFIVTIDGEIIQ